MEKENLVKIYGGPEASALLLKEILNEMGIESMIKNDSMDAFLGTSPESVDLYISGKDFEKTKDKIRNAVDDIL
jgi:hypothetical protein